MHARRGQMRQLPGPHAAHANACPKKKEARPNAEGRRSPPPPPRRRKEAPAHFPSTSPHPEVAASGEERDEMEDASAPEEASKMED